MSFTLILVIMTGFISYQAFGNPEMLQRLLFYPYHVKRMGEFYRFISHGLVHANWTHLLINLLVLYQFGEVAEAFFVYKVFGPNFGRIAYLLFYFSAVFVAAIPAYVKNKDNQFYRSLGASGATSALVFIYILIEPWAMFLFPPLPAILMGVLYLWYSSYMSKKGSDNIAHDAHLYGAVYGLVFALVSFAIFNPSLITEFLVKLMDVPPLLGGY